MKSLRRVYETLTFLNLVALPVTLYLTYAHYKPEENDYCNFGESFNCDIVNKSTYSEIFDIPVAVLGAAVYLILLVFSLRGLWGKAQEKLVPYALALTAGGVAFSLYLTYVEAFILKAWCVYCLTQQVIIALQLFVFIYLYTVTKKK